MTDNIPDKILTEVDARTGITKKKGWKVIEGSELKQLGEQTIQAAIDRAEAEARGTKKEEVLNEETTTN